MLLDLNMPKKNALEVLPEVKRDPALRSLPVVVLTSSEAESDILKSYDLQANCYITKPVDLSRFLVVVRNIEDFRLCVVQLPFAVASSEVSPCSYETRIFFSWRMTLPKPGWYAWHWPRALRP